MSRRIPPKLAAEAALAARRLLIGLADRLIPAQFVVFERTAGVGWTHVVGTVAELGVADLVADRPATADELAARLDVDADALHRVMRAAASAGLFRLDRTGRFSLTRLGRPLTSSDRSSMRDWARYMALPSTTRAWADLSESVRRGHSAFRRVHGSSVWEWFAAHPDEERLFAGGMRRITEEFAPGLVGLYPWPEDAVVCDVAGGVGTLLAEVLDGRHGIRGVLVDAASVLAEADSWLARAGVRDRVELVAGDLFDGFEATADVFLLKDILHDWDDNASLRILRNVRATMRPGDRLLVIETLQDRNRPDELASLQDLQMLVQCEQGRQRSAEEIGALLEQAALHRGPVRCAVGPALVEAHA